MRQGVDPATREGIVWHESLGVLILVLTLLRLVWAALRSPAPQVPISRGMKAAAKVTHFALWSLMLALPMTALLSLASEGHPLTLRGGLRIDQFPLIAQSSLAGLADWGDVHTFLGDAIAWIVGLHAAAAIAHHWVLKDGVLRTMLPLR